MECVLLVEPDVLVRDPLAEYFRECGYRVWQTSNVADARFLISDRRPAVSIILAEANSAGESGFALAYCIRSSHPHIDVILAGSVAMAAKKASDICEEGPAIQKLYDHQLVLDRILRLRAPRERSASQRLTLPRRQ